MASRAYLLINVHSGKEDEIQSTLQGFEEVVTCDQVTGDSDLIAVVETTDYQQVLGPFLAKIRSIDGITHTSTCLVL
jgi:DNA-binding Lrp family transcriptional regulator